MMKITQICLRGKRSFVKTNLETNFIIDSQSTASFTQSLILLTVPPQLFENISFILYFLSLICRLDTKANSMFQTVISHHRRKIEI